MNTRIEEGIVRFRVSYVLRNELQRVLAPPRISIKPIRRSYGPPLLIPPLLLAAPGRCVVRNTAVWNERSDRSGGE